MARKSFTFNISGLMATTCLVAVHVAFPWLVSVLLLTLYSGALLLLFIFAPLSVVIAFSSKSKNGQLDVDSNPNIIRLFKAFAFTIKLLYIVLCSLALMAHMLASFV